MRAFRQWLVPLLTLLGFAVFVGQPLFRPQLFCTDDAYYHLNKAVSLAEVMSNGHVFGRWMPDMAHGYGFPYFNYYAPLASYILIALHGLGFIYPVALHVLLLLCIWLAGVGAYTLTRAWWGAAAGLVAGVVYLTAPYFAFDIVIRGAVAEIVALVWPPWVLFTFHRALAPRGVWKIGIWDLLAVCTFTALLYTHNTTALAVVPLVVGYVVLLALWHRDARTLLRGANLIAVGLALAARFWLPALAERALVQSDRLLVPPIFTYYTNYITMGELLALPARIDPLLINPSPAKGLGLLNVGLAGLGFVALIWRGWHTRPFKRPALLPPLFFALALTGYALLTLSLSHWVWDNTPLIRFIQFPWRMLGPGALCAAVLAGGCVASVPRQWAVASVIVVVISLGNLSWWYPRYCNDFSEVTLATTMKYERDTFTIGTTAKGEFLPVTVKAFPADETIADAYIRGETPQYLTHAPPEARVTILNPDVLEYHARIETPIAFHIRFNQFYFPGWQAWVDEAPAAIQLTPDTGLMLVAIPAGTHTVRFHFGDTPLRAASEWVSWLTLAGLVGVCGWAWRRGLGRDDRAPTVEAHWPWSVLLIGFALLGARVGFIDRTDNFLRHSAFTGEAVTSAQTPLRADFEGHISLYGYDLSTRALAADDFVDVALYVSMREGALRRYWPSFNIEDAEGVRWNLPEMLPPRWHKEPTPTYYWPPEQYAQWARHVLLLPGTPPGEYTLTGEVFDLDTLQIMSVLDEQGNAIAPRFNLGTLTLTRPQAPAPLQPEQPLTHSFGVIELRGYHLHHGAVKAGDTTDLTLYWRSLALIPNALTAQILWLDETNSIAHRQSLAPVTSYPTSQWQVGDEWRGQQRLRVPAALPDGRYRLALALADDTDFVILREVQVTAPPHVFTAPAWAQAQGAVFEGVGVLAGYTFSGTDLTLIWRASATPATSYNIFVHVSDASGRVWAQSDGVPVQWARPTPGWVAGEYLTDLHTLNFPAEMPPGSYTVFVGLYDSASNTRVAVSGPGAEPDGRVRLGPMSKP